MRNLIIKLLAVVVCLFPLTAEGAGAPVEAEWAVGLPFDCEVNAQDFVVMGNSIYITGITTCPLSTSLPGDDDGSVFLARVSTDGELENVWLYDEFGEARQARIVPSQGAELNLEAVSFKEEYIEPGNPPYTKDKTYYDVLMHIVCGVSADGELDRDIDGNVDYEDYSMLSANSDAEVFLTDRKPIVYQEGVLLLETGTMNIRNLMYILTDILDNGTINIRQFQEDSSGWQMVGSIEGFNDTLPGHEDEDAFVMRFNLANTRTGLIYHGTKYQADLMSRFSTEYFEEGITTLPCDGGGLFLLGNAYGDVDYQVSRGGQDAFVLRMDKEGKQEWVRYIGSISDDEIIDGFKGRYGSVIVLGNTTGRMGEQVGYGHSDLFVTQLDRKGKIIWTRILGTPQQDEALMMKRASDKEFYVLLKSEGDYEDAECYSCTVGTYLVKYVLDDPDAPMPPERPNKYYSPCDDTPISMYPSKHVRESMLDDLDDHSKARVDVGDVVTVLTREREASSEDVDYDPCMLRLVNWSPHRNLDLGQYHVLCSLVTVKPGIAHISFSANGHKYSYDIQIRNGITVE